MGPIDYSVDVKSPFEQATNGFASGLGMRENIVKAQQLEQQQKLQLQLQTDLSGLANKPDASAHDYANMMVKYPQLSEHFKRGWDTLNGEQQQSKLSGATQVYAAVNAGKPEIATQLLTEQATALRNSGKEDEAKAAETMAKFIEMDPKSAKTTTGLLLASIMGPEKFADTFTKLQGEQRENDLAPSKLTASQEAARKAKSEADLSEIKARYGERSEIADLATKGWNVKKVEEEIRASKENTRIAALNSAISRANSDTQRGQLTLERDKYVQSQSTLIRERTAEITQARSSIDNMLNTADQILKHPGLSQATGSIAGRLPSFRQDSADFDALMENLNAQAFTSQIPAMKGMGALSDAEGKKLGAALQSFDTKQSPEQLRDNVKEAQRLVLKARKNLVTKYGIPDTVPDTPQAAPSDKDVNDLLNKYGPKGATGKY